MAKVTNISTGPRGAYLKGQLVMAERGQTIEADDYADEWFAAGDVDPDDIGSLKKADLIAIADAEGVAYESNDNRSDLVGKIEAHRAAAA